MLAGLDNLTTKDRTAGNRFNGKVDLTRVAAMGYSQGGRGAMAAAHDSRVDATVTIQPWNASASGVRVPTLYLAGSSDAVVDARARSSATSTRRRPSRRRSATCVAPATSRCWATAAPSAARPPRGSGTT